LGRYVRNIFDQYTQPENRVTHALLTALNEDRVLLRHFLHDLVGVKPPADTTKLDVLEQRYPGLEEEEPSESELERRGIPDGWIVDDTGWCVFIENKVISSLTSDQIARHRRTAERRGFERITAVAIAPAFASPPPPETVLLAWPNVYAWLKRRSADSLWAARAADFLEIIEAQLIDNEQLIDGALTMFSGFPFNSERPYTYLDGKRVLGLAMQDLRKRRALVDQLGMNREASGRSAITGRRADVVWDFLTLAAGSGEDAFTNHPHLTLGVRAHDVDAMVTVPNAVNSTMRRNLVALGEEGFQHVIEQIVGNLHQFLAEHPGATPWFRGIQRRYPSQRSAPYIDACIEFDLRTAIRDAGPPKAQPRWLTAAYGSFVNKEHSNYQMQVGVILRYDRCPEIAEPSALDLVEQVWLACKPLVDFAH